MRQTSTRVHLPPIPSIPHWLLPARALVIALPLLLPACGKSSPGGSEPAASSSAAQPAASAAGQSPDSADNAKSAASEASPQGIQVAIKDVQLFHPYSKDRTMASIRDNGTYSTRASKAAYGVGVIVEATNDTGEVLRDAWFEGDIRFTTATRQSRCTFDADLVGDFSATFSLAYVPLPAKPKPASFDPPTTWKSEIDSSTESVWRPSERIRMFTRKNECESLLLGDLGATKIHGRVVVKARRRFVDSYLSELEDDAFDMALLGDLVRIRDKKSSRVVVIPVKDNIVEMVAAGEPSADGRVVALKRLRLRSDRRVRAWEQDAVESAPLEFDIPARAMTLQKVKLPETGEFVHASGNILVYPKDGKVVYQDMARQKLSLLDITREDVPATPPEVAFQQDELSAKVTQIALVHFTDNAELSKGQRRLAVTWKLNLRAGDIEGRLRAPYDVAVSELEQATAAVESANSSGDDDALKKAKATETKAKTAKAAAETKYKTNLSTERGRIAKLLSCGDIKLATNKGVKGPSNAKAAGEACKALTQSTDAETTLEFTLDRYELPVALVYSIGKDPRFSPIASESLLRLDPR